MYSNSKLNLYQQKILLYIWWITVSVTYNELLNYGQIITANIYSRQLQRVKNELLRKQPSVINRNAFLQDNARSRTTRNKLNSLGFTILFSQRFIVRLSPFPVDNYTRDRKFRNWGKLEEKLNNFFVFADQDFFRSCIYNCI